MTTDRYASFWTTIDAAHRDRDALKALLAPMSREELLEFYRDYKDLAYRLREPPFVDRGTDYQEELTWYVVAQGRAAYEAILAHPETFPGHQGPDGRAFISAIGDAFFEKFDEEIQDADAEEPG